MLEHLLSPELKAIRFQFTVISFSWKSHEFVIHDATHATGCSVAFVVAFFRMNYEVKYAPNWVFAFFFVVVVRVDFVTTDIRWWSATSVSLLFRNNIARQFEPPEKELSNDSGTSPEKKERRNILFFPMLLLSCLLFTTCVSYTLYNHILPATNDEQFHSIWPSNILQMVVHDLCSMSMILLAVLTTHLHWPRLSDETRTAQMYCRTIETFILHNIILIIIIIIMRAVFGLSIFSMPFWNLVSLIYLQHCRLPSHMPHRLLPIHWNFCCAPIWFSMQ